MSMRDRSSGRSSGMVICTHCRPNAELSLYCANDPEVRTQVQSHTHVLHEGLVRSAPTHGYVVTAFRRRQRVESSRSTVSHSSPVKKSSIQLTEKVCDRQVEDCRFGR